MLSTDHHEAATAVTGESDADSGKVAAEQPPAGELSLGDALAFAVRSHRSGAVQNAEKVYRKILELIPEQPDALNFLAMIEMDRGKFDMAIALMRRSLAADPEHGERYNNLGNLLFAAEHIDEAVEAYEQAIARCPATAAAFSNLGIVYRAQGRLEDAARAYDRALELDAEHVEAWNNYGNLHVARGEPRLGVKCYAKALTLRPGSQTTQQMLAVAFGIMGDLESAAKIYRRILEERPDDPCMKHLLAAVTGVGVPARAADDYIVKTFDAFAVSFDQKLAYLEYRAPQLVASAVASAGFEMKKSTKILDVGCGTGLCGALLAPYAAMLHGVDLSAGMLDRARSRAVYDELAKAELTEFLQSRSAEYDLVVSVDTLCYFGVLDGAIGAASHALRADGCLIFTVEEAEETTAPDGYRINPHGRYSHTRDYVDRTLGCAGFTRRHIGRDVLRQEGGMPVNGLVVVARKAAPNAPE
jgi:predicted TPR repeat methyltransferase